MNYAKAKQLAQKMFGPTARLERGQRDGTWVWAVLVTAHGELSVAGSGGSLGEAIRDAAKRVTKAQEKFAALSKGTPTAGSAE